MAWPPSAAARPSPRPCRCASTDSKFDCDLLFHKITTSAVQNECVLITSTFSCFHPLSNQSGGYQWNTTLFPDANQFLTQVHALGLEVMTNQHDQCTVDHCQDNYAQFATRMGVDPSSAAPIPCEFTSEAYSQALVELIMQSGANALVDYQWEDYGLNGGPDGTTLSCEGGEHCMACLHDLHLGMSPMGANSAALWRSAA